MMEYPYMMQAFEILTTLHDFDYLSMGIPY
jgi:hypothetical protein